MPKPSSRPRQIQSPSKSPSLTPPSASQPLPPTASSSSRRPIPSLLPTAASPSSSNDAAQEDGEEGNDPIEHEIPIYLSHQLAPNLHLFQYPVTDRVAVPEEVEAGGGKISARWKEKSKRFEMEVSFSPDRSFPRAHTKNPSSLPSFHTSRPSFIVSNLLHSPYRSLSTLDKKSTIQTEGLCSVKVPTFSPNGRSL
jgi:hypothetical protein